MGKDLSPLAIVLILALFAILSTPIYLSYQWAIETTRLSHMQAGPDEHLFFVLGSEIYEYDESLNFYRTIDLKQLNAHSNIGNIAFFSNGDLLIRQGDDNRDFLFNYRRFQRLDNETSDTAQTNDNGLVRCQLETAICEPFGDPLLNLNDTFHLAIDWDSDRVYIADSGRHSIKVLSESGSLLMSEKQGLKFPNQIIFQDSKLYVTNTNKHEITVFDLQDNDFVRMDQQSFRTDRNEIGTPRKRWPAELLLMGDQIWVINYKGSMADGEAIRFSHKGDALGKLQAPDNADLFGMLHIGDEVLVSDYENNRIYRYDLQGAYLGEFAEGPMFKRIAKYNQDRADYYLWMKIFIALFVAALVTGMVIGVRQSWTGYKSPPIPSAAEHILHPATPGVTWLEVMPQFKRQAKLLKWLFISLLPVMLFTLYSIDSSELFIFMLVFLPLGILSFMFMAKMGSQRIGVYEETLILMQGDKHVAGTGASIYYTHNQIGVGDLVVTVRTNYPIFHEQELVAHVYPLLKQATSISNEQMLWQRAKNSPSTAVLWGGSILLLVLAFLVMELNWF